VDPNAFEIVPLSFLEVLQRALLLCKRNFCGLVAVAAVPWIITALAVVYLIGFWQSLMPIPDSVGSSAIIVLFPMIIWTTVLLFEFAQTVLLQAISAAYIGRKIVPGKALLFGLVKMKTVAPTSFVFVFFMLLLGCGLGWIPSSLDFFLSDFLKDTFLAPLQRWLSIAILACFFGFVFVRVMLFDKVAAIENLDSLKALSRSWELLSGKATDTPWPRRYDVRMFFLVALWLFTSMGVFVIVEKLMYVCVVWVGPLLDYFANSWRPTLPALSALIASLFGSVATTVFYYDIRFRKDGLDPAAILAAAGTAID
jgi:hypothetical protein